MGQPNADYQKKRQEWRMAVRRDERLTEGQRLILTALDEFRNSIRDDAYPTNTTLGNACCTTRESANRALNKAEELGYLVAVSRPRRSDGRQGPVVWKFRIPRNQSEHTVTLEGGPECAGDHTGRGVQSDQAITGGVIRRSQRTPEGTPDKDKPAILTDEQKQMLGIYT